MKTDNNAFSSMPRREMLSRCGMGLGLLGLASLLQETGLRQAVAGQAASHLPMAPRPPHFAGKAKRVVHLFMNGGPSHLDTFDPKPLLDKLHGKPLPSSLRTERKTGAAMRSPFTFKKYGRSGLEVSELFAKTAEHADDLAVIRSMQAEVPNHEPSLMLMNCGDSRLPRPSVGSWVTYGLGTENQNLPGFIVLCPGGFPVVATQNWRSAFLPGAYQGTYIDTQHSDIEKLIANIRNPGMSLEEQRKQLDLLRELNQLHAADRDKNAALEARIATFELAFRMQTEAAEAFDISKESQAMREMYGTGTHGRQLLITRRLLERGVRFVQVWSGAGQPWDNHEGLEKEHRNLAAGWDQPIAAFLKDLKERGLFDSTLVLWGGEFGRTPVAELPALSGRDHNHYGFTCWMAGGGIKGGTVYGSTDEFGFRAADKPVHVHDLHATMLHLLGLDHERLTFRYAGRDFRLTDVHGHVIKDLIA
jgi:DNA-binding transcriptional MerR regulator